MSSSLSARLDAECAYEVATYGRPLNDYLPDDDEGLELDRVKSSMCDQYCRYPREYDEEAEGVPFDESGICDNCPLNKYREG